MKEQTMTKANVVNGVNVGQLFETIEAIKENGVIAKFKFRARNRWEDGGLNRTTLNDFDGGDLGTPGAANDPCN